MFCRCWKWESVNPFILFMLTFLGTPSRISAYSVYSFIRFWVKRYCFPRNLTMDIHFPNVRNLTILSLLGSQINTVLHGIDEWLLFRVFKLHCNHLLRTWHFKLLFWTCKIIFQMTLEFNPGLLSLMLGTTHIFTIGSDLLYEDAFK